MIFLTTTNFSNMEFYRSGNSHIKTKIYSFNWGMYYPLFNLVSRRDTFTVELKETVSPYNLIDIKRFLIH